MHTLTECSIPYFLWPGIAVGILAVLLDPWRKAILSRVPIGVFLFTVWLSVWHSTGPGHIRGSLNDSHLPPGLFFVG
jgi:hypothetical protein